MHSHSNSNLTEKVRKNPWMLSSLVLGVLVLALLFSMFSGNFTGNVISKEQAGETLLTFYQSLGVEDLTINSISEVSGVYEVDVNYQDNVIPLYITKDGKNVISDMSPLEATSSGTTTTTEVPKSDKPSVELYVFTYCPYGLQMEKAILPVVELLGDKIDFKIRQIGAMHGEYEEIEAKRQLCVEKNYPAYFLDYIRIFAQSTEIGNCQGDAACLSPKLNTVFSQFDIERSKIDSCMNLDGDTLYDAEVSNSNSKGISGSPTLVINGVETSSGRSPEEIKGVICSAFNNVPSECSTALSTAQASAGFGAGTSSGSSTASC